MNLVIYDSTYGNTRLIADAIAKELGSNTKCVSIDNLPGTDMNYDLIAIGCPINAWHPTAKITVFLRSLSGTQFAGKKAAAFDTRVKSVFSGNAAKKIATSLENAGAVLVVPPVGFYVKSKEGPLVEGEIERAISWAKAIKSAL